MNIASTQYSAKYKALEIYIAGCKGPHCIGCHNSNIWDFDKGVFFTNALSDKNMGAKLKEFDKLIDRIWVLGGEPLDQNIGSLQFLFEYLHKTEKEIWLFTRYQIEDVPLDIRAKCDFIKCGPYDASFKVEDHRMYGLTLATSNQVVLKRGVDYFI